MARENDHNVLGGALEPCSFAPRTGFYRDGCCNTGPEDVGLHVVCVQVTAEFLDFARSRGNDLITPVPAFGFPGLKPGDRWTLVQQGLLHTERLALAVLVYGDKQGRSYLIRWDALFPSMCELRRRRISSSPIAWGTAHLTAMFVKCMPHGLSGVYVPEALPATARRDILQAARPSGIAD